MVLILQLCSLCFFYVSSPLSHLISILVSLAILVYWSCHWPMPHQGTCFLFYFPFMCRSFYNWSDSSSLTCPALPTLPTISTWLHLANMSYFPFLGQYIHHQPEKIFVVVVIVPHLSLWYIMQANVIFSNTLRRMKSIEWKMIILMGDSSGGLYFR